MSNLMLDFIYYGEVLAKVVLTFCNLSYYKSLNQNPMNPTFHRQTTW